jgi:hypothetical protein
MRTKIVKAPKNQGGLEVGLPGGNVGVPVGLPVEIPTPIDLDTLSRIALEHAVDIAPEEIRELAEAAMASTKVVSPIDSIFLSGTMVKAKLMVEKKRIANREARIEATLDLLQNYIESTAIAEGMHIEDLTDQLRTLLLEEES